MDIGPSILTKEVNNMATRWLGINKHGFDNKGSRGVTEIDNMIRVTELPAGSSWDNAIRLSPLGKRFPIITRFLPRSERFFEHIMLECEKQDAVSDWATALMKRRDDQKANLEEHLETMRETRLIMAVMRDERCKRVIMDARQASTFNELGEAPPQDWQHKLRTPFDWFYLEFSDPVMIGEQENIPDADESRDLKVGDDYVRGMLIRNNAADIQNSTDQEKAIHNIILFLTDEAGHHTRRAFLYDLSSGKAWTRIKSLTMKHSADEVEPDISQIPQDILDGDEHQFIQVGDSLGIDDRYFGYWERILLSYSSLVSWLLTYMMSKGIEVSEERLPRAMRRREMRKDIPKPWHIVQVEPRFRTSGSDVVMEGQQSFVHNIRYDVMGHLRCNRKKNEDGSFSNSFIWVRPHQRGLANDIYVPKTASFKAGKEIHPVMNSYFPPEK